MNAIVGMLGKVLLNMLLKVATAKAIEELVLLGLKKLVDHTDSPVDNEIYDIVEKYLKEGK